MTCPIYVTCNNDKYHKITCHYNQANPIHSSLSVVVVTEQKDNIVLDPLILNDIELNTPPLQYII